MVLLFIILPYFLFFFLLPLCGSVLLEIIASRIKSCVMYGAEMKIEVTMQLITDKIHSLRNYYSSEKCEEEAASKKSGFGEKICIYLNSSFSTFLVSKN